MWSYKKELFQGALQWRNMGAMNIWTTIDAKPHMFC